MSIETVVEGVEAKVETVAEAVVAEVKADVAKVEEKVKAALVEVSTEDKLYLRSTELEFLKMQMEIQRITKLAEDKSKGYAEYIEKMFVAYAVSKAEYVFDGAVNVFKKL
jgi:hypothetical protein